jgi:hypothetical protein
MKLALVVGGIRKTYVHRRIPYILIFLIIIKLIMLQKSRLHGPI